MVGAGRVGTALSFCLRKNGVPLLGVTTRDPRKARELSKKFGLPVVTDARPLVPRAGLILLAVSDSAAEAVARELRAGGDLRPGTLLGHTSGALPSRILKGGGAIVFSLHPLRSFSEFDGDCGAMKGTAMIFEGDAAAMPAAKSLCRALDGVFIPILAKDKPAYHTAASMTSNFLVTLTAMASRLNEKAGISKKESLSILVPLLKSTLSNIERLGLPAALTGPIERGDALTVEKHLEVLRKNAKELVGPYKVLARETLKLAESKGLPPKKRKEIGELLGA